MYLIKKLPIVLKYTMSNENQKIFIQIASYRDPELMATVDNCLENSDNPENLFFGICWQHDADDNYLLKYINNPNFKIISVYYTQSKGCCWARNKVQQLYNDEQYTLQLDSHHRFIKGWDTALKNMYKNLLVKGIKKPILTTYLPSYNPCLEHDPNSRVGKPWKIDFAEITPDNQVLFKPSEIDNYEKLIEPVEAKFFSAHFVFTSGNFIKEIPYDPKLYFTGEEMSMGVRAFTKGYTLFHPHLVIAWHEYTRNNRSKHWDDDKNWWKKDLESKKHYFDIFSDEGIYGIGNVRTVREYINYSGVKFIELEYKKISDDWKKWIKENIVIGVGLNDIKKILIDAGFGSDDIDLEINEIMIL